MIAEKASDMIRETDTVKPIKEYFKHLIATKHKKFVDPEEEHHHQQHHQHSNGNSNNNGDDDDNKNQAKKYKKHKKH